MASLKKIATLHVDGLENRDYVNCDTSVFNYDGLNDYHIDFFDAGRLSDVDELTLYVKLEDDEILSEDDLDYYIDEINSNTNIQVTGYTPLIDFEKEDLGSKKQLNSAINEMNALLGISDNSKEKSAQEENKKSLLDKIKDSTSNCSILQISANISLTEDSWEEGELGEINSYELDSKLYVIPLDDSIDVEIYKKFMKFTEEELSLIFLEEHFEESLSGYEGENHFYYSGTTDEDGNLATIDELELWKKGEITLYNKSCQLETFINGNPIDSSLLLEIAKSGRLKYDEENKKNYSVWVGGTEVNDSYLTKKEAEQMAEKYTSNGYEDVEIDKFDDFEKALKDDKKTSKTKMRN
jgi:hypothetical protein